MRLRAVWVHAHVLALCRAQGRGVNRHIRKAVHIYPEMIGRGALIVKDIYPADLAEIMLRDFHIPLIEGERLLARRDGQIRLRNLHHHRPAHSAERAIARRELSQRRSDLELNSPAMAGGGVGGHS